MPTATSRPADFIPAPARARPTWEHASGARVIIGSTLGAALLTLCFFAPRFWLWPVAGLPLQELMVVHPEFHRAFYALQQLQDPWQRISDPVNRVIEWRLFWPLISHHLGFSPTVYFAIPFVGCLAALAAVATLTWRATRNALPCMAATLLTATSSWFFVSTGWLAYFDSWVILALVLATFARSRVTIFSAALIAPWIDERFILAAPICLAVRSI